MRASYRDLEIAGRSGAFAIRGAFDIAEAMLKTGPSGHPFVLFNLGYFECRRGNWESATRHLELGRIIQLWGEWPPILSCPIYDGQDLDGKTLHFRCEWGLGDQILFVRFAREFRTLGAHVIMSCAKEMVPLFRLLGETRPRKDTFKIESDYWAPSLACPRWFPVTGESYLTPNPEYVSFWKRKLEDGLKIGIRWSGNPAYPMEALRRFPAELMISLADQGNAQFYSFQRDDNLRELPPWIIDLKDDLKTWDDTAAALSCMDLVISSDTGMAHLSAALGRPTWIVIPIMCGWQWAMPGERTPWYDSVHLFRQETFGEWNEPFKKIRNALKAWSP